MKTQFFKGTLITVRKVVIVWLMGMILILAGSKVFGQITDLEYGIITAGATSSFTFVFDEITVEGYNHQMVLAVEPDEFRFRAGDEITITPTEGESELLYILESADIQRIETDSLLDLWIGDSEMAVIAKSGIESIMVRGYIYEFNSEVQVAVAGMARDAIRRRIIDDGSMGF
jgi:hypothetical protein